MFCYCNCQRAGMSSREKAIRGWICIALACLVIGLSIRNSSAHLTPESANDRETPVVAEAAAP